MRTTRRRRGAGLLEAVIAMGVITVGAAGLIGLSRQSTFLMADSRKTTRAAAFAQDLVNQIELWDFDDPRLANAAGENDGDVGDGAFALQLSDDPVADKLVDHGEADLTAGGKEWAGLPSDLLRANGMERYWSVAYLDDYNGNGVWDAIRVAVVVRWPVAAKEAGKPSGSLWRRMVFTTVKINPGDLR